MAVGVSRRAFLRRASVGAGAAVLSSRLGRGGAGAGDGDGFQAAFGNGYNPPAAYVQPDPVPALIAGSAAPAIITRAQWGADEAVRRGTPAFSPPRKIVVHHTALASTGDYAADVREVYKLHLDRDGGTWADIGYQYLIDPDGRVYEGRWARDYADGETHDGHDVFGRIVRGSHAMGFNTGTMGIALMGDFQGARPTDAALNTLVELTAWLCAHHALDPGGAEAFVDANNVARALPNIIGHRDVRDTLCPGQVTFDMLPELRQRVVDRLTQNAPTLAGGYRILASDGTVAARGTPDLGDPLRSGTAGGAFVALASSPAGDGVWVADGQGGIFTYGSAGYRGSVPELRDAGRAGAVSAVHMAATPTGAGYWLLDRDGGVYAFGDAAYQGSIPQRRAEGASIPLIAATAIAPTRTGAGYWVLDRDGGVFSFGDATYYGSLPELRGSGIETGGVPAVDLAPTPSGAGYWVLDRRGGVFAFGDAVFFGSVPQTGFAGAPASRLNPAPDGSGYLILCEDGAVLRFGGAVFAGHGPRLPAVDFVLA